MPMFNQKEDEINFGTFIKFPLFSFRLMFFRIEQLEDRARFIAKVIQFGGETYYRFCLLIFPVAITMLLAFAVVNSDNLVQALSAIPNAVTIGLIAIKGLVTFVNRKKIWQVIETLRAIFEDRPLGSAKSTIKIHLDEYQKCIKAYAGVSFMTFVPIVLPAVSYAINGTMKLTVDYYYPFDPYTREFFPIALLWIDWVAWNSLFTLLGSDSLFFALVALIEMEFHLLKEDFIEMVSFPSSEKKKRTQTLIDHHNKLLDLCDDLSQIYSPTFLASFVITSFSLCFVAFQLSTGEAGVEAFAFYIPYLFMLSGQVYLVCAFGQNLIDATQSLADGIYESGWEEIDDEIFKKQLVLIIQRSQRAKRLTAMNFAEVSLQSFTAIFTTAGSYYTLLKNVYSAE